MTETMKKFVRIIYYAAISTALVAVAVLLMVACVNIYNLGDFPFTPEIVAYHFSRIAVPVYLCLGLVAVGFILHPLLPDAPDSDKDRDRMTVQRLRGTTDLSLCPAELATAIRGERKSRRLHQLITLGLFVVGLAVMAWYALSFDRFSMEDINGSFENFGLVMLPCLGIPGGYGVFSLFYNRVSYKREIALYRQVPKEAKRRQPEYDEPVWEAPLKRAILMLALALILIGLGTDGIIGVLDKSINICTECVGLG